MYDLRSVPQPVDGNDFWYSLIWDLRILAEKDNPKKDYSQQYVYSKLHHPKNHRCLNLEPIEPFICPKCGLFHSYNYVISGKKPVKCRRCHTPFSTKIGLENDEETNY